MLAIDYCHTETTGFETRFMQTVMSLFGLKAKARKKMINNNFAKAPAKLPLSLLRNCIVKEDMHSGRKVWTISPKEGTSNVLILYLHGGAYMANIMKQHWQFVHQLVKKSCATVVVPDYPLAPEAHCLDTIASIEKLYIKIKNEHSNKRLIFMGDSAGGGLALGFVQKLRNENKEQPSDVILFSPWLDLSMSNPELKILDKNDKILSIEGLKSAGQKYAANLNLKDFRVSPLYGNFKGLCKTSIFTSTNDLLYADAKACKKLLNEQNIIFNFFEYPKVFHTWIIFTQLRESIHAINQVIQLIDN